VAGTSERGAELLVKRVKERIGTTVDVALVDTGALARSEGKLKRLYDLRP
jgi:phenylacetate-CoA ligase